MKTRARAATITVELPEELVALIGSRESVAARVREVLVLDLLREVRITQGQAARLLGITRWDILQLMVRHQIPSGPATPEEVDRDIAAARLGTRFAVTDASGQQ